MRQLCVKVEALVNHAQIPQLRQGSISTKGRETKMAERSRSSPIGSASVIRKRIEYKSNGLICQGRGEESILYSFIRKPEWKHPGNQG